MAEMLGFCPVISRSSPEKPLYGTKKAGSPPDDTSIIAAPLAHLVARRFEQAIEWADHALHEQLRLPLQIALLNLMPDKVRTETQLLRVLGGTPL
jgi:hypothetical protein